MTESPARVEETIWQTMSLEVKRTTRRYLGVLNLRVVGGGEVGGGGGGGGERGSERVSVEGEVEIGRRSIRCTHSHPRRGRARWPDERPRRIGGSATRNYPLPRRSQPRASTRSTSNQPENFTIVQSNSLVLVLGHQAQPRPVVGLALAAAAVLDLVPREVGRRLDDLDVAHGGEARVAVFVSSWG